MENCWLRWCPKTGSGVGCHLPCLSPVCHLGRCLLRLLLYSESVNRGAEHGQRHQPCPAMWVLTALGSCPNSHLLAGQPTRLPRPWDSQGKNTRVGCHFLRCRKVKSESAVIQSCPTLSDPMDCSLQGSSVHGIFQAKYWSGVLLSFLDGL